MLSPRSPHRRAAGRPALAILALFLAASAAPALRAQEGDVPNPGEKIGIQPLPPAESVIVDMIAAEGGREAMEEVRSRVIRGELDMVTMGMKAQFTSFNDGKGNYRETMTIPGNGQLPAMEFEQGLTDGVAWSLNTMQGARILEGVEKDLLRRSSHLHLLLHIDTDYVGKECTAKRVIHERTCYELKMTPAVGSPEIWYVDVADHLNVRTEMTIEAPMIGKLKMAIDAFDWREVDGLRLPHRMELQQGPTQLTLTVSSYEHNAEIPPEKFELPATVQALLDKQRGKEGGAEPETDAPAPGSPPKEGTPPEGGAKPEGTKPEEGAKPQ